MNISDNINKQACLTSYDDIESQLLLYFGDALGYQMLTNIHSAIRHPLKECLAFIRSSVMVEISDYEY